ncbi:MAG: hypothetical protein IT381_30875 [Deltaproteobacteria bacterium]|nr:hypothetical protein [Deltaproteobacteria bacterium]
MLLNVHLPSAGYARAWNTMMPLAKERGMHGQFLGVFRYTDDGSRSPGKMPRTELCIPV